MKIFGTIRNSKNQDPVKDANIRFSIEGTEITSVISNEHGKYEYIAEQDYIDQTLDFAIQKDGFERKNISYEIDKDEIKADILLNEIETEKKEIEEVIEKTRIFGTIRNSVNRDPVQEASIKLSIEGTQIAAITSNKQGEYEYIAEQDYTGQTLDISIKKDNYIKKNISYEIDGPTIKSDILLDEIKIKIKGKICDETDSPLDNASISFSIGNSTIYLTSDKDGSFSFTVGQQFLNQTIGYEVNKEGFKITSGKLKLLENLKCINISKTIPPIVPDKSMWIKVAAVGTVLTVVVVVLFALPLLEDDPQLSTDPDPIDFDFVSGTGAQTFSIWNDGDGTLEWNVYSDRDWIIVSPDSGTDSSTVSVSVNSVDMDPGRHTGRITVESDWGTETGRVSLYIRKVEPTTEQTFEPTTEQTFEPTTEQTFEPTSTPTSTTPPTETPAPTVPLPLLPMPTGTPMQTPAPTINMKFELIPAGEFDMGSEKMPYDEEERYYDEGPVHHVKIEKAFYIGRYEVTQKQWHEIMGNNPSYFRGNDLPVEQVSWDEVQEFIERLNEMEDTDKYRLPSEAEWEYAYRGGTTTKYSFGDDNSILDDYAWYGENSDGETHPVGQKKPNPYGLYDTPGNVWEWVQDKYHDSYNDAPTDGSAWESGNDENRVARGGSYSGSAADCRSTDRGKGYPEKRYKYLGFRLLKEI